MARRVRLTSPGAPERPSERDWPELDGPLAYELRAFTATSEELIRRELPPWPRRVSGYALDWLLPENGPDHARAMVGTEGTCAVIARAVVRLVRPPRARALLVLGFTDDVEGAGAVPALLTAEPFTVESLSAELLALAHARSEDVGLPDGGAWLMVESRADDGPGAREHGERLAAAIGRTLDSPDVRFIEDTRRAVRAVEDPRGRRRTLGPPGRRHQGLAGLRGSRPCRPSASAAT